MEGAGRSWGTLILQEASLETGTSTEARTSNGIIHLNTPSPSSSRVHWSPDTVDNEGLGKKKSNVCCIFHKEDKGHCQEGGSEDDATRTDGKDDGWNAYEQQPKCDRRCQRPPASTNTNGSFDGAST